MAEFKAACSYPVLPQAPPLTEWKAPPSSFFKVNTNAKAFDDVRNSSIRVVIHDNMGEVLATSSKVLPASFSIEILKALAMQEGVLLVAEMEVSQAIFKSNALSIIQAINDGVQGGELGHIIWNIRKVSSLFS